MRFEQFRRGMFGAVLLSALVYGPAVWGIEGFIESFTFSEAESELEMFSGENARSIEIELETGIVVAKTLGEEQESEEETSFGIEIEDLTAGMLTEIEVGLQQDIEIEHENGFGAPVVDESCFGLTSEVACPGGKWFSFGGRSFRVSGNFPAIVTTIDPTGGETVTETTARVALFFRATNQPVDSEISRRHENRVWLIGRGYERSEDGLIKTFTREGTGPDPGSHNRVEVLNETFYRAEVFGSILVDGKEWLDGVDWTTEESTIGSESGRLVETSIPPQDPCGDFFCDSSFEDIFNCPQDCFCGNFSCDGGENFLSCPQDCPSPCGDGICSQGEDIFVCPQDCFCGNSTCDPGESNFSCSQDCFCGNHVCDWAGTDPPEDSNNCSADCSCGDGTCNPFDENNSTCPQDCP